jgi:hypothetical protein
VLAFRLARQHLAARVSDAATAAFAGLQDTPPGTAALALAARADVTPEALDELVIVLSVRGAPMAVAPADLALFTAGREPPDEKSARALVGNAWKELEGISAMEALDRVSDAVADALSGGPLVKDDFHQALRERLPQELLWWCKGCASHHVHPSLWRATGIRGVLAVVGREGRSPLFGAPPEAEPVDDPGAALARRFLSVHGPATPHLFAAWAGITPSHGQALWERAGELVPAGDRWLLPEDAAMDAPPALGARLLPNLDPLAAARDRDVLVPDADLRKRIWAALGGPGFALLDGEVAALWRPQKKGKRLVVALEPLRRLTAAETDALGAEAERIAPFRGAESGELAIV